MLLRKANRDDPDQTATAADLGLCCLSRLFLLGTYNVEFEFFFIVYNTIGVQYCFECDV